MQEKSNKKVKNIAVFNPDVMLLEQAYRDFPIQLKKFNAGQGYENFNSFITDEATQYRDDGDGVTYVIWNIFYDKDGNEREREIVSFYTLAATAIPYEDRIRLDEEERSKYGEEYDIQICGISAIEIKMFAVDEKYQDVFFDYNDESLPISAWVIRSIIDTLQYYEVNILGFKAIFLHSVPEAEKFYSQNGFNPVKINMRPLHCIDSDFQAMYLSLKEVQMNYDE